MQFKIESLQTRDIEVGDIIKGLNSGEYAIITEVVEENDTKLYDVTILTGPRAGKNTQWYDNVKKVNATLVIEKD